MHNTIVTDEGITLDLSQVIAIELQGRYSDKPMGIRVIFKLRKEYVYNPETESYELHDFRDEAFFDFPEYETACVACSEWRDLWRKYKSGHGKGNG